MSTWIYTAVGLAVVGAVFSGVYVLDRERRWWSIIPGLAAFTLAAALVADAFIETDPANDWASVLVISVGAAVTSLVLRRIDARRILAIVAAFALVVGILMSPLEVTMKVVVLALIAVIVAIVAWGNRSHRMTLGSH